MSQKKICQLKQTTIEESGEETVENSEESTGEPDEISAENPSASEDATEDSKEEK